MSDNTIPTSTRDKIKLPIDPLDSSQIYYVESMHEYYPYPGLKTAEGPNEYPLMPCSFKKIKKDFENKK